MTQLLKVGREETQKIPSEFAINIHRSPFEQLISQSANYFYVSIAYASTTNKPDTAL
jgi:hypothetical protein